MNAERVLNPLKLKPPAMYFVLIFFVLDCQIILGRNSLITISFVVLLTVLGVKFVGMYARKNIHS